MNVSGVIPQFCDSEASLTARGIQRRNALIEATLRIVIRDGHHAVTLRSVSLEAGSSHGSVNYYFGSRIALMSAAADRICQRLASNLVILAPLLESTAADPEKFASAMVDHNMKYMINDRDTSIAIYELTLAGARDDELRSVLVKWGKVHSRILRQAFINLGSENPETDYAFVLNSLGGLIVAQLAYPRRDFESRVLRPSLRRFVFSISEKY